MFNIYIFCQFPHQIHHLIWSFAIFYEVHPKELLLGEEPLNQISQYSTISPYSMYLFSSFKNVQFLNY